jgi:hypothetical protein
MRRTTSPFGSAVETLESPFLNEDVDRSDAASPRGEIAAFERPPASDEWETAFEGPAASAESIEDREEPLYEELDESSALEFDAETWSSAPAASSESSGELETWEMDQAEAPFLEGQVLARDGEPYTAEAVVAESEAADTTLANERLQFDPDYISDDGEKVPPVWADSDATRFLLDKKGDPDDRGRVHLSTALTRQLKTVVLYTRVQFSKPSRETVGKKLTLYVVLFPGETKDNTGIKDLNDKILHYQLNLEYTLARQAAIERLFPIKGPLFALVGQDYKTATILAPEGMRKEFVAQLTQLDRILRDKLLELLKKARAEEEAKEKEDQDKERLKAISALEKTLKPEKYRFDIFFGLASAEPRAKGRDIIDITFVLVTEALKAAGLARVIAKAKSLEQNEGKAFTKDLKADDSALDSRGKEYESATFLAVAKRPGDINEFIGRRKSKIDYQSILVDTVWTTAFVPRRRLFEGNPDVIRDVRKKLLERPRARDGNIKFGVEAQREMLELWLVFQNTIDFVKDFLSTEFRKELVKYHDDVSASFLEVTKRPPERLDWPRLQRVLTHDLRQTEKIAVLGTASEFQFYSYAADYPDRIFFSIDIRDLGVALMLLYERANEDIAFGKLTGVPLMERTFKAADAVNLQRRRTYNHVVEAFRKYFTQVGTSNTAKAAADGRPAFGVPVRPDSFARFSDCVQVMLGGDEVFVAAHGYFEPHVHKIVADLAALPSPENALGVRTVVSYSRTPGEKPSRSEIQQSHQKAMSLAEAAPSTLKKLERTGRRIERLIEKLEGNPKKKDQAPKFRTELEALALTKLFARMRHGKSSPLARGQFVGLLARLRAGDLAGAEATGEFELVDFAGRVVNAKKLEAAAAKLEGEVRRLVGGDNMHIDPPPVTQMPALFKKWLDRWADQP